MASDAIAAARGRWPVILAALAGLSGERTVPEADANGPEPFDALEMQ